jgi:threonine dehydrogenase-like Zn-dependent dehydrogenase
MQLGGNDRLLITGLGPVGLAAAQLAKAMGAKPVIGIDISPARRKLAEDLGLCDFTFEAGDRALSQILDITHGKGCEVSIDCSGASSARLLALQGTRQWGRCAFVGEGGTVQFDVSPLLIHQQITLFGSWVTSTNHMQQLVEHLDRWGVHPEITCTERLPLEQASRAYDLADKGQTGKVCLVF